MKHTHLIGALLGVLLTYGCALQQDVVTLDNRTLRLENQMSSLQKQMSQLDSGLTNFGENKAQSEQDLRTQNAEIRATLGRLTEQVQELRGRVEEGDYRLTQQVDVLERSTRQMEERVAKLESYLSMETRRPAATPEPQAQPARPASESETMYEEGRQLFEKGDNEAARRKFTEYLQKFPSADQADNAQFWIAETYYREKWLEKAILEYQKVIETYPKGNKVPASLLKQALAFSDLGDKTNARLILEELIAKFPQSNEAGVAREKLKEL
ncbi:MAG: tol-pal system protein YbgF [Desulfobacterales bacterium]